MAKKKLVEHTRPLRLAELGLETQQEKLNLMRARREAEAHKTATQTRLQVLEMQLHLKSNELERIQRQIEKCKIFAPGNGTVRYPGPRGKTGEAITKKGATVRQGQRLLLLVN